MTTAHHTARANHESLCCGTPWKSKGYHDGYRTMSTKVFPARVAASGGGELPVVCDAASCTEGLETMERIERSADASVPRLRFVDSTVFAVEVLLPRLEIPAQIDRLAIHHTRSTTILGANSPLTAVARAVAVDVYVPTSGGCCAFAGDRGLLHPELTASATAREAAQVRSAASALGFDAYASANCTCELG